MTLLFPSPDIGMFGRRQRHVRGHRIPVTIARTGLPEGAVLVVDDFVADEVRGGDCPCCTIREKLQQAIRKRNGGEPISHLAIQTDADVVPILRTFVAERALGDDFYVESASPLEGHRFTVNEPEPVRWEAFSRFVTTLTALRGSDLLQMKGVLSVAGCRGPVAVQFMGHLASRPVELQAWPDGKRASRIEFVTRGIEEKTARELFDAVRALA